MNAQEIMKIFEETAYVRMGGSAEELKCANYLKDYAASLGLHAEIEPFTVDMATIKSATLVIDGKEIPCKGYMCSGSGEVEAPFYYLRNTDPHSLSLCKDKIVMIDGYLGYWLYQDLIQNGAVGFISYSGDVHQENNDIDARELRALHRKEKAILGVNINVKDAVRLIESDAKTAKIVLDQEEYEGRSHNVVIDLPGEIGETVVLTAHYDSTSLSTGAYDNMSGCVGLLGVAEYFRDHPHRYGLRFIFCGSEERGLLGAKAYVAKSSEEERKQMVLNINLDMIGSTMGHFIACCSTENELVHYIKYFGSEMGFGISVRQDVYSSDSTPFADAGIPALSFARAASSSTSPIHNRHDTLRLMSGEQMVKDIAFITAFTERMVNACRCPVNREIPDSIKSKLDLYLCRKRK